LPSFRPLALLALLPLLACTDGAKATDDTGGGGGSGDGSIASASIRLSTGVETVVIVEWTLGADADEVWIEYGADTAYGTEAPARADDASGGWGLVLGVPGEQEVHARVAASFGGEVVYSDDLSVTTGAPPSDLFPGDVEVEEGAAFGEFVLTSYFAMGEGDTAAVIVDRAGNLVWYSHVDSGTILAARPSRDGTAVLYQVGDGPFASEDAVICRADLSGEDTTCTSTPMGHHDFVELADGSWVYPQAEVREWDGYDLVGDTLVSRAPDGTLTELWDAFDNITPVPTTEWDRMQTPDGVDWTHTNGIWHDEATGDWYLSFLHLQMIHKVSGGMTEWVLGGDDNEFAFDGPEFGPQHAPMWVDGNLWLYDNSSRSAGGSRVAAYSIDATSMVATATVDWEHPDRDNSATVGDANPLGNGFVGSGWGELGDLMIWSAEGEVVWRFEPGEAVAVGQVYAYDDLYSMAP
jgi:hypothetical protein